MQLPNGINILLAIWRSGLARNGANSDTEMAYTKHSHSDVQINCWLIDSHLQSGPMLQVRKKHFGKNTASLQAIIERQVMPHGRTTTMNLKCQTRQGCTDDLS
ncbi:hypothetical protein [Pseudomonas maumuensis]|uniref:Uncharacterized protein n=1 Tax=Pseudomonas maumuensis TaxID=2842354 RepID=A0ABX8NF63_9PSED|nr:hypothetical protein [Pseudomonas maumuensis]QXH55010.1 hypothetical protein KSS90_16820 [Pseudomonas maumuensis]